MPPDYIERVELDDSAVDTIADRVAERMKAGPDPRYTPNRTIMGDADGVSAARKPNDPGGARFYGGDDKYTSVGSTAADIAVNLFLVKTVLETPNPRTGRPYAESTLGMPLATDRLREVMVGAATKAIESDVPDIAPYVSWNGYTKAQDTDGFVNGTYKIMRAEARTKAMTSTGANAGDEWVPTFASSELWRDVHLQTTVGASVPRVQMPTNPYTLPTLDSDVTFYLAGTENVAVTGSEPNTGNATLTASKIAADVTFSGEVTEDSVIPLAAAIRANLTRRGAQQIDDGIVHGDTETAGTGNINTDDAARTANSADLAFNGMRKFCIVTNTGQASNLAAAMTTTNFTTARALLLRYGARPSDLRLVMGPSLYYSIQDIDDVTTVDKYGPQATILQGELGRFFGVPILLSEAIPGQSTDKLDDDGKYTTTSPSTNDTDGWFVLFNVNGWKQGFRREFQIESDRNIQTDSNILVASYRHALIPSGISVAHTVYGYNITV